MPTPSYRQPLGMGGGFTPPPRPITILIAIQIVSLILDSFAATEPLIALFRLTPAVWRWGFVWQLATYPFVAFGGPSLWFLVSMLMLAWFGGDVWRGLGRRHFWRLLAIATVGSGLVAAVVFFLLALAGADGLLGPADRFGLGMGTPFLLMQGQTTLLILFTAAFGTAYRYATVTFFWVLPVQARWLLGLEVLVQLIRFLQYKDLPGFLGSCATVGIAYLYVSSGGSSRGLGRTWQKLSRWPSDLRSRWRRKRRGIKAVPGSGKAGVRKGPWVN